VTTQGDDGRTVAGWKDRLGSPRGSQADGQRLTLDLPASLIESIAELAAEIAAERLNLEPEPWIGVEGAAEHLDCPRSRIYALVSKRAIPFHKDGSRLLFRCSELDRFIEDGRATR
jgi:excisionase family DNA binding protein